MATKLTATDEKKAKKNADQIKKLITKATYRRSLKLVVLTFKDKDVAALFKLFTGGFSLGKTVSFEITSDMDPGEIAAIMQFVTEVK